MKTCSKCASANIEDAKFCNNCGTRLLNNSTAVKTPTIGKDVKKSKKIPLIIGVAVLTGIVWSMNSKPSVTNSEKLNASTKFVSIQDTGAAVLKATESQDFAEANRLLKSIPNTEENLVSISEIEVQISDAQVAQINNVSLTEPEIALSSFSELLDIDGYLENLQPAAVNKVEDAISSVVKPLPANKIKLNRDGYALLSKVNPSNQIYSTKASDYADKFSKYETELKEREIRRILSKYRVSKDKFEGSAFYKHPSQPRYTNSRSTVYLYIGVKGNSEWLRMQTQYTSDDWLFVRSVEGYADGETFFLTAGGFERDNNTSIWEWKDESPSKTQLKSLEKLANASDATLRFEGNTYRKDVKLRAADKKAIKDVLGDFEKLAALQ